MATNSKQTPTKTGATVEPKQDAKSIPARQPAPIFAPPPLARPLAADVVKKAELVFKNFTLSKFPKGSVPENHVPVGKSRTDVHGVQRKVIEQHLHKLSKIKTPNKGMTIALPTTAIKELLPNFDAKKATIDLTDLMNLIEKNTRGNEFFANGDPTLNRLRLQAQAKKIIEAITTRDAPADGHKEASAKPRSKGNAHRPQRRDRPIRPENIAAVRKGANK